jgi:hypothetical protein
MLANQLLESLNHTEPGIDAEWAEIAEKRVAQIKLGNVKAIPGDEVFRRIQGNRKQ